MIRSRIECAVLAGGRAARYGGLPKGTLPLLPGGASIIGRLLAAAAEAGVADVLIVANDPAPYRGFGRRIVPDLREGMGPLGGIEAALASLDGDAEAVLVLPCDLPGLTGREVAALRDAYGASRAGLVYAAAADGPHPLCAAVHRRHAAAVRAALDRGERRPAVLWRELGAEPVEFRDPRPFFNVNSPEEMNRWLERQRADASR